MNKLPLKPGKTLTQCELDTVSGGMSPLGVALSLVQGPPGLWRFDDRKIERCEETLECRD